MTFKKFIWQFGRPWGELLGWNQTEKKSKWTEINMDDRFQTNFVSNEVISVWFDFYTSPFYTIGPVKGWTWAFNKVKVTTILILFNI